MAKSKVKSAKSGLKEVTDEIKNLPTTHLFYYKYKEWWLNWYCPNLIKLALDGCGRCDNPLLNDPVGFGFHFSKGGDTIYPMTYNAKGMMFPLMGWNKIEGVGGNDEHKKEVIIDIIKKLADVDKMTELFDHYNKFCFRKELDGKSLLNDL